MDKKFVVSLEEIGKEDIPLVGGKGANLGEMTKIGMPVPPAFIVISAAYFYFLDSANLRPKIKNYLASLNLADPDSLERVALSIRKMIMTTKMPDEVAKSIMASYEKLGGFLKPALVAVRSSATAEDLPTASFAGQQETFLNVGGEANVVEKVRLCWASLWLPRAIFYREEQKFNHFKVGIAVPVQKMIQSDCSGVIFTIDPLTSEKKKIVIEAIYGLGELIVQGQIIPDRYAVNKDTLEIIDKEISVQDKMLVKKGRENQLVDVPRSLRDKQKITDKEIIELAHFAKKIERHYFFPQDIEWAIEDSKIYILQTRPVTTVQSSKLKVEGSKEETKSMSLQKRKPFLIGVGASPGIATGTVKLIKSVKEINRVNPGDVLVAEMTNPDFVPAMRKAVAIVTDKGGRTAHAAIVSRELGIPCIVGAKTATKLLKTGQVITVNGQTGEIFRGGLVERPPSRSLFGHLEGVKLGHLPGEGIISLKKEDIVPVSYAQVPPKTATKVYLNLAEPERIPAMSRLPVDGVGLLRAEFMMAQIGIHPKKIIKDKKQSLFIDKLSTNIASFCEAFAPRPVVYRATDFKTNEYRHLQGGKDYEPEEVNPMLGFRGAYRYLVDPAVFELELAAIKQVRHKNKLTNLWLMIPFVRSPRELREIKKIISGVGLLRSPSFKLWLMVELPANVILLEQFIEAGIDGVSIGSNDLTMLILGVDRDNAEVAPIFNEQDPAVLWALEKVIKTCLKYKITSSICGQAPSDYPGLVEQLVKWGITSVSVNPDAALRTREIIYEAERRLAR